MRLKSVPARARRRLLPYVWKGLFERTGSQNMIRLGTPYGGWWVPEDLLVAGVIAYSGGLGEDASFDLELTSRGLHVWAFDPTPKAIAYAATLVGDPNFHFEPLGWFDSQAVLRFFEPENPDHASYSATNLQRSLDYIEAPVDTVAACAARLGHENIAIIKMDIEGLAHEVVANILEMGPYSDCICVEFDQPSSTLRLLRTVRRLRSHGFHVAKIEGWNFTFVR